MYKFNFIMKMYAYEEKYMQVSVLSVSVARMATIAAWQRSSVSTLQTLLQHLFTFNFSDSHY